MAIVPGVILETGQSITVNLPTARTSELPSFDELSDEDLFNAFDVSENKAKKLTASQLRDKINGAGTTAPPVINGADMEISIPETLIGQKRIDIPALAGLTFWLERIGSGRMWSEWFNAISTGGFELTRPEDQFWPEDKFVAHIYEYEGGNSAIPGNNSNGQSFIKGIVLVDADYQIKISDFYYVINIQAGDDSPILTLPDLEDIEENAFVHLIAMINTSKKSTIKTTNGQYIYINGSSFQQVYIGPGETLRLYRGLDGFYCIDAFGGYANCGRPIFGYAIELNTLPANGQEIRRDAEPRLWQKVQTFGNSLIAETLWQSDIEYQGCFSTGDGVNTFRLPNLRGTVPRFWDNGRGLDANDRIHNYPGGYQKDANKKHKHTSIKLGVSAHASSSPFEGGENTYVLTNNDDPRKGVATIISSETSEEGSIEATMKNTALMGLICT